MATRRAFLDAAHAMAESGGRGDPLDPAEVAAHAGVSRPLFYAHFPTRGDFVDALLTSVHESDTPPSVAPTPASPSATILRFFDALAAPLDRHAALARILIPASHLPGPVATARAARRAAAIGRLEALLPSGLTARGARAAFLFDAFLGIQLWWAKEPAGASLAERVRRGMRLALTGILPSRPTRRPSPRSGSA